MTRKRFELLVDCKKEKCKDINKIVVKINRFEPNIQITSSTFSAVGDANRTLEKIFRINKSIKQKSNIPNFIFL